MILHKPNRKSSSSRSVVPEWTPREVSQWLSAIHMENLIPGFIDHHIDGYSLLTLSDSDLTLVAPGKNPSKALSRQLRRLIQIWRKIYKQPEQSADILRPTIGAKAAEKLSLSMSITKRDSRADSSFEAIEAEVQRRIMRASAHITTTSL